MPRKYLSSIIFWCNLRKNTTAIRVRAYNTITLAKLIKENLNTVASITVEKPKKEISNA